MIFRDRADGVDEIGDLGLVGIADNERNAGESGDFFRGTLGIATGYQNARGGIGGVNLADRVAGLGIGGGGYGTSVENDDVGSRTIPRKNRTLFAKLAFDGRAVSLRGAAAELFDKEGAHQR